MKVNIKNILTVVRSEYVKFLFTPKMILIPVILIPMREWVVIPLMKAAEEMDMPINILEPCIGIFNSWLGVLLMTMVFIILISSFPTVDDNMLFYISRMGRKNWIIGELAFLFISGLTYWIIIIAGVVVQTAAASFINNGWSIVITDHDELYSGISGLNTRGIVPPNLYSQMTPFKAFFHSSGLLLLGILFCAMMFFIGSLYLRKLLFFVITAIQVAAGCGLIAIENMGEWLFPISHSILYLHYSPYFRAYIFPPWASLIIFIAAEAAFAAVIYRKAKRVNLDMIGGDII